MGGPRAVIVAAAGALLAAFGAAAASPLFPIGVARRAEPDPGLHADWIVLAAGVVAIIVVVSTIAFVVAVRSTRPSLDVGTTAPRRTSSIPERASSSRYGTDRDQRPPDGAPAREGQNCRAGAIRVARSRLRSGRHHGRPRVRVEPESPRHDPAPLRLDVGLLGSRHHLQRELRAAATTSVSFTSAASAPSASPATGPATSNSTGTR